MIEYKDAVSDTTTTVGTGTITLGGVAPVGYLSVSDAHTAGATVEYRIENDNKTEWENGEGVLNAGKTTMTRPVGKVTASSNGGGLVNFSAGTKTVITTVLSKSLGDATINGQALASLASGILKNTTTTGVPSIAVASDFPTLNQNTSGTAEKANNLVGGAAGAIPFQSSADTTTFDATNLTWDNTNKRLGVGTNVPLTPIQANGPIASSITNSTVSFEASSLDTAYPRAQFKISNGASSETNTGLIISPVTNNKPVFIELSTYAVPTTSGAKQILLYTTNTVACIGTLYTDGWAGGGNPLYFSVGQYDGTSRNGLIINNDENNNITIGSDTIQTIAQCNIIARSTLDAMYISGNVGFDGNSARSLYSRRHTTANTAGNSLTVQAGGATSGATDKSGGQLVLKGGIPTGTGTSGVTLQGYVAGSTGAADCTAQDMVKVVGNTLGFFNGTPVVKQTVTGSKASGAALASLLTALANLGLITDSTTA